MKMMAKGAVGTLAAVVLLFVAAASVALGQTWYYGYAQAQCKGYSTSSIHFETIHNEILAGRVKSYEMGEGPCIDVNVHWP